jgi:hypothetical protein
LSGVRVEAFVHLLADARNPRREALVVERWVIGLVKREG